MDFLCVYLFIFWFRFKLIGSATVFVISQYYYYIFLIFFLFGWSLGNQNPKWTINHEIEKKIYIYIVYLRAYFCFLAKCGKLSSIVVVVVVLLIVFRYLSYVLGVYQVQVDSWQRLIDISSCI